MSAVSVCQSALKLAFPLHGSGEQSLSFPIENPVHKVQAVQGSGRKEAVYGAISMPAAPYR
jgi:hypothetical protein